MLSIREIIQELFYEKTRIVLTIFAIAWGTFAIAIMLAIGEGLRLNFASTIANAGDNLLTITAGVTSKSYMGTSPNQPITLTRQDITALASLPNVENVAPQYKFNPQLRYRDRSIYYSEFYAVALLMLLTTEAQLQPASVLFRLWIISSKVK